MKTLHFYITLALATLLLSAQAQNTQWAKAISGADDDEIPIDLKTDSQGNLVVLGYSNAEVDFDPSESTFLLSSPTYTPFIAKYSPDGELLWAAQIGCDVDNWSEAEALAIDENDNIYVTGEFTGTIDFDLSFDEYTLTSQGNSDIFVLKTSSDGTLSWVKSFDGDLSGMAYAKDIAVKNNEIYVTGYFEYSIQLDANTDESLYESAGHDDVFIMQLDADGNYVWSYAAGSEEEDRALSIDISDEGNVFITGFHEATMDFAPGSYLVNASNEGAFVVKYEKSSELTLDGTRVCSWAKSFDGAAGDIPFSTNLVVDADENVYVAGSFLNIIELTNDMVLQSASGELSLFLIKMNNKGAYQWAIKPYEYSSNSFKEVKDLTLDRNNNVYLCGNMGGIDFFRKIDSKGTIEFAGSYWANCAYGIAPANDSIFYVASGFEDDVTFNLNESNEMDLSPAGYTDMFIAKQLISEQSDDTTAITRKTKAEFSIFPNPANDKITIKSHKTVQKAQIFTVDGKLIKNYEPIHNSISVANLASGIYILNINNQSVKFIKQ